MYALEANSNLNDQSFKLKDEGCDISDISAGQRIF